jgi:hypothetical protein
MASSGGKLLQLFEMHAGEGGDFRFKVVVSTGRRNTLS